MKLKFFANQMLKFEVYMVVDTEGVDIWVQTRQLLQVGTKDFGESAASFSGEKCPFCPKDGDNSVAPKHGQPLYSI
jgi:hypothetical protein